MESGSGESFSVDFSETFSEMELCILDAAYDVRFENGSHADLSKLGKLYLPNEVWLRYDLFFEFFRHINYIELIVSEFGVSRGTALRWIRGDIVLQLIKKYVKEDMRLDKELDYVRSRVTSGKLYKIASIKELSEVREKRLGGGGRVRSLQGYNMTLGKIYINEDNVTESDLGNALLKKSDDIERMIESVRVYISREEFIELDVLEMLDIMLVYLPLVDIPKVLGVGYNYIGSIVGDCVEMSDKKRDRLRRMFIKFYDDYDYLFTRRFDEMK